MWSKTEDEIHVGMKSNCKISSPGQYLGEHKIKIMLEKKCLEDELKVSVSKRRPKFKAGTELANSVNQLHVDSSKEETEGSEIVKISLQMVSKSCVEVCK